MLFGNFLGNYRKYGPQPSTHDWAKFYAITLMIVDHYGHFFDPDELWWRVAGRLCVPVWLFLAGYAKPRALTYEIPLLGGLMVLADILFSQPIFSLNILFSITCARLFVWWLEKREYAGANIVFVYLVLLLWYPPLFALFEYGSLALMFALAGYLCRRTPGSLPTRAAMVLTFFAFVALQQLTFAFGMPQLVVLTLGSALIMTGLYHYRIVFSDATRWRWGAIPVMVLARNSYYVYVLHYIAFETIKYGILAPPAYWTLKWFIG